MSGPNAEGLSTPQTGPVLGEDARAALSDALVQGVPYLYSEWDDGEDVGKVLTAITPVIRALVGEAERRGEERGAQAERDRIAVEFDARQSTVSQARPAATWAEAARIARGTS